MEAFFNFDQDKDGYLTIDELRHIVTNVGEAMPAQEIEEFLAEADPTGSGSVNFQQLAQVMGQDG